MGNCVALWEGKVIKLFLFSFLELLNDPLQNYTIQSCFHFDILGSFKSKIIF